MSQRQPHLHAVLVAELSQNSLRLLWTFRLVPGRIQATRRVVLRDIERGNTVGGSLGSLKSLAVRGEGRELGWTSE